MSADRFCYLHPGQEQCTAEVIKVPKKEVLVLKNGVLTIGNLQGRIQSWWGPYCPIILKSFRGTTDQLVGKSSHLRIFFGEDLYFDMLNRAVVRIDRSLVTQWPHPMLYRFSDEDELYWDGNKVEIQFPNDTFLDFIAKWSGFSDDSLFTDFKSRPLRVSVGEFKRRFGAGVMYGNSNYVFDFSLNTSLRRPHVAGEEPFTYPAKDVFYVPMYPTNPSTS
eukprot:GILI01013906.1.p1 GENE.GILI01013906.1~~GILI01013906.1.p1  ORF type:complete len:229 (+),score=19.88 GILI01013906.1:28-687(+)